MRKYTAILLVIFFIAGTVIIANAEHERVIPYESIFGHKETMPRPEAGDLRHHMVNHSPYKVKFKLWPGKKKMSAGTEPHGSFITIYVNDRALKSLKKGKGMANNSIILKENYAPDKQLAAVTVMYKVKGYNPSGGDWFWVKYNANFDTLSEGKVKGCMDCHSKAKGNDYIFTGK